MQITYTINPASVSSATFINNLNTAIGIIDSTFTANITVHLEIGYGVDASNGATLTNQNESYGGPSEIYGLSYSTLRNDLLTAEPGFFNSSNLPNVSNLNGVSNFDVSSAQARLFGILPANAGSTIDGYVSMGTGFSGTVMIDGLLHEITHALGRDPDNFTSGGTTYDSSLDVFRFLTSGSGRDFSGTANPSVSNPVAQAYFSLNGGLTDLADFGVYSDPTDWLNSQGETPLPSPYSNLTPNDPFDEYVEGNGQFTNVDKEVMEALGFSTQPPPTATSNLFDFNGDGYGDILLQSAGGQIEYANMAGGSFHGLVSVTNVPGWNVVGQGNISGGADSDIVIQNGSQMYYVDLVNGAFSQFVSIGNPTGYVVVGVGDIADDHYDDVVIQNPTTYEVGYANMDNGVFNNWFSVADPVGWKAVAVADINDDGHADIVIQNKTTGEVGYANMSNGALHGFISLGEPQGYNVVGAGDVNGLGDADVVVQNPTNGSIGYANMINGAVNGWVSIGNPVGWSVIAVEDILDNGFDDIVIQNNSTGQIDYANMTGGSFQGWVGITIVPGFTGKTGPGSDAAASGASEFLASDAGMQNGVQTDDLAATNYGVFAGHDAAASNGGTISGSTVQEPSTQYGSMVSGITVQDPGPQNGGTASGIAMQDPGPQNGGAVNGITMQDPGPQDGFAVSGITMQDPGPQNGGAVSSMFDPTAAYGGLLSAVSVLDPGTTGAGAVTGSGPNDQGSASWLTAGTLPGGTSVGDNQDLNSSSTAFVVTADSLQHALKTGT